MRYNFGTLAQPFIHEATAMKEHFIVETSPK